MGKQELRVAIFNRSGRPLTDRQIAQATKAAAKQVGVRVTGTAKVLRIRKGS